MRIRSVVSVSLIVALLLGLMACGAAEKTATGESDHSSAEVQSIFTQPISSTTSEISETTVSQNTTFPTVQGADSVEMLLEKSLEYIRTKDYSKISDVHDVKAWLAYLLLDGYYEEKYSDNSFTLDYALEKVDLMLEAPETLYEQDPDLPMIVGGFVYDPDRFFTYFYELIRDSIQDEDATDSPDYEMYSEFFADYDKGTAYLIEHSIFVQQFKENGLRFDVGVVTQEEKAMLYEGFFSDNFDLTDAQIEYHPDNSSPSKFDGLYQYEIGVFDDDDHDGIWRVYTRSEPDRAGFFILYFLYYVKDETYYLIGYRRVAV